jgi:hypothetical protein
MVAGLHSAWNTLMQNLVNKALVAELYSEVSKDYCHPNRY